MTYSPIIEGIENCFEDKFVNPFLIHTISSISQVGLKNKQYYFSVDYGGYNKITSIYFSSFEEAKEKRDFIIDLIMGNSNMIEAYDGDDEEENDDCLLSTHNYDEKDELE